MNTDELQLQSLASNPLVSRFGNIVSVIMEIGGCVTQSTQTLINISTLLILHSLSLTVSPLTVDVHWILGWSPSQLRFTSCPALYTLPPVLQSFFFCDLLGG